MMATSNRYSQIIEHIFLKYHAKGAREVPFTREDIVHAADRLKIALPKNLGDLVYSFRYRAALPESIARLVPKGQTWIIRPNGRAKYKFVATTITPIKPHLSLVETKIPDSTPGVIIKYALSDEQALLAKLRYNRLIDIFTGIACYSLQNHLRTTVPEMGQVETDEIYIGLDRRGAHYVFPVQAKGGSDKLSIVQIEQDIGMCRDKFPDLISRPIAAQFMAEDLIALFEFETDKDEVKISAEKHYRLVPPKNVTPADLEAYRLRPLNG